MQDLITVMNKILKYDNTSFAGSILSSVIDEMKRSSPQAIKITNSFFNCIVFLGSYFKYTGFIN